VTFSDHGLNDGLTKILLPNNCNSSQDNSLGQIKIKPNASEIEKPTSLLDGNAHFTPKRCDWSHPPNRKQFVLTMRIKSRCWLTQKILAEIMSSSDTAIELKVFVGVNTVITRFEKKSTKCALNVDFPRCNRQLGSMTGHLLYD
jgi:hypothetical protein